MVAVGTNELVVVVDKARPQQTRRTVQYGKALEIVMSYYIDQYSD